VEYYDNSKLDKYSLLNDAMDKLAKQYWEETNDMNSPPTMNGAYGLTIEKSQETLSTHPRNSDEQMAGSRQKT
jgi:hypothetical protein